MIKKIQLFEGIHPKQAFVGLTRLNWTPFVTHILVTLMEMKWILKMIVFGSGLFTNDVINLKHQGAGQKQMIG